MTEFFTVEKVFLKLGVREYSFFLSVPAATGTLAHLLLPRNPVVSPDLQTSLDDVPLDDETTPNRNPFLSSELPGVFMMFVVVLLDDEDGWDRGTEEEVEEFFHLCKTEEEVEEETEEESSRQALPLLLRDIRLLDDFVLVIVLTSVVGVCQAAAAVPCWELAATPSCPFPFNCGVGGLEVPSLELATGASF